MSDKNFIVKMATKVKHDKTYIDKSSMKIAIFEHSKVVHQKLHFDDPFQIWIKYQSGTKF